MIHIREISCVLIISLILFLFALPGESAFLGKVGTRPLGMGGAFVGIADESSAFIWNTAGLAQMKQTEIVGTYDVIYSGLGEGRLVRAYVGYTHPLKNSALGINYIRLQSPLYRENTFAFSFSKKLRMLRNPLYLGVNVKGLFANFVENEYTKIDPLFQNSGLLTKNFGVDVGMLFIAGNLLSFGVFARNINQPNIALGEDKVNALPLELSAGIAFRELKINPSFDFTYRNDKIRGEQDINLHLGLETETFNNVKLRTGANLYELATGGSYYFNSQDVEFQLDYAFRYPMPFNLNQVPIANTTGSHQFSLSFRFGSILQLMEAESAKKTTSKQSYEEKAVFEKALSYQKAGDYKAAISVYKNLLKRDSANQEVHFLLANLYTELKRYEKAIEHYKSAIELEPSEPRFHYALARLYEKYGDNTGNKSWYNKAIIEFAKIRMLDEDYDDISSRIERIRNKK